MGVFGRIDSFVCSNHIHCGNNNNYSSISDHYMIVPRCKDFTSKRNSTQFVNNLKMYDNTGPTARDIYLAIRIIII